MQILRAGEVVQATPEEIASIEAVSELIEQHRVADQMRAVRLQRNSLLAATDWTVLPDSPISAEKKS